MILVTSLANTEAPNFTCHHQGWWKIHLTKRSVEWPAGGCQVLHGRGRTCRRPNGWLQVLINHQLGSYWHALWSVWVLIFQCKLTNGDVFASQTYRQSTSKAFTMHTTSPSQLPYQLKRLYIAWQQKIPAGGVFKQCGNSPRPLFCHIHIHGIGMIWTGTGCF